MARGVFSTSNYFQLASAPVTAVPLTMACWFRTTATGTYQTLVNINNSASANARNAFSLRKDSSNFVSFEASDATSFTSVAAPGTVALNTWNHAAGVATSATSRVAYYNGAASSVSAVSRIPVSVNRTTAGAKNSNGAIGDPATTTTIAEIGIWNVALTSIEISSLAVGASPLLVRPSALVAYWPLVGVNSPENNIVSTVAFPIIGTISSFAHTRMFDPE